MAYSMDFRHAVARAYDDGDSSIEVAEQFGCSASWVRRLIQHRRERGTLQPRTTARTDDQRTYDDADEAAVRALIKAKPDATLREVATTSTAKAGRPSCASPPRRERNLVRRRRIRTPGGTCQGR